MSLTRWTFLTWILAINLILYHHVDGTVSVESAVGTIIGNTSTTSVNNVEYTVNIFKGIPYARAPVGELRFQKPVPMPSFEAPFKALEFGNVCQQPDNPEDPVYKNKSEDCLFLNVYVPVQTSDEKAGHAVMVWIHGGGLLTGAGQSYPAGDLCFYGNVILVTINYRLGFFGFLDSQDGNAPGNQGLHDQHLALKWVNKNIGAFGGDNTRVTIFGQSAGGSSVAFQALYPGNEGFLHRVIEQSAVTTDNVVLQPNPRGNLLTVAMEFPCASDETSMADAMACLKAQDANSIMDKLNELSQDPKLATSLFFITSLDGDIIKGTPRDLVEQSKSGNVEQVNFFRTLDFTTGFNNMDGALYLMVNIGLLPMEDIETFTISREDFINKVIPTVMGMAGLSSEIIKSLLLADYTDWTDPNSPIANRDQYIRLITDMFFSSSSIELARLHANTSGSNHATYTYVYSAKPSNHIIQTPTWVNGANHGDELGYEFLFEEGFMDGLMGGRKVEPFKDWEYQLAYQLATYFTNFAKTGNPNQPTAVPVNWPRYENVNQKFITFDRNMSDNSVGDFFYSMEANLWLDVIPEVTKWSNRRSGSVSGGSLFSPLIRVYIVCICLCLLL